MSRYGLAGVSSGRVHEPFAPTVTVYVAAEGPAGPDGTAGAAAWAPGAEAAEGAEPTEGADEAGGTAEAAGAAASEPPPATARAAVASTLTSLLRGAFTSTPRVKRSGR